MVTEKIILLLLLYCICFRLPLCLTQSTQQSSC